jgi:hypothetical protein
MAIMVKQMMLPVGLTGKECWVGDLINGLIVTRLLPRDRLLFFAYVNPGGLILLPVLEDGTILQKTDVFPLPGDKVEVFLGSDIPGIKIVDGKFTFCEG